MMESVTIDGLSHAFVPGERLVEAINRSGTIIPQVCYHPQLGPIQTCDTCIVEVNGQLVAGLRNDWLQGDVCPDRVRQSKRSAA